MKRIFHARDENALRNGSFILERIARYRSTFAVYMNGDFVRYQPTLPTGLQRWTARDAKKLLPPNL